MKITIAGAVGRMGQELLKLIHNHPDPNVSLYGATVANDDPHIGLDSSTIHGGKETGILLSNDPIRIIMHSDVVIDFTQPKAALENAQLCASANVAYICGTTGFTAKQDQLLQHCYTHIPVLRAANFSLGINLMLSLARQAAAKLPELYDIEILEMHHNQKVDAPSGTALALGEACANGRGILHDSAKTPPYYGIGTPRETGKIGYATLRGGTIAGEHQVIFAGIDERLILEHRASSRTIFAQGALHGALWLYQKPAGLYSMADLLEV